MRLLLRRRIAWTGYKLYPKFALRAKFDLTPQERGLVDQYRASEGYITIEAARRDMWRGVIFGFLAAVVIAVLIV